MVRSTSPIIASVLWLLVAFLVAAPPALAGNHPFGASRGWRVAAHRAIPVAGQWPLTLGAHIFDRESSPLPPVTYEPMPNSPIRRPVLMLRYPSPAPSRFPVNNTVIAFLILPDGPGPHPAVIVLHEWAASNLSGIMRLCEKLADSGTAALVMVEPYTLQRTPDDDSAQSQILSSDLPNTAAAIRQAILDARRGLDILAARPDIDPNRMGAAGISLGGILAAILAQNDPRVKTLFSIAGGADLAGILWSSPLLRGLQGGLRRRGYVEDDVRAACAPFEVDRARNHVDPADVLLVDARYDVFVNPDHAYDLAHAFGDPPIVWTDTGHFGTLLVLDKIADLGATFLQDRFARMGVAAAPPVNRPPPTRQPSGAVSTPPRRLPGSILSPTFEAAVLVGGHEGVSPAVAAQVIDLDRAARYSLGLQLTLHGFSGTLGARLTPSLSIGLERPIRSGDVTLRPFVMYGFVY
ncbi:MAG: dienelactone hydrolase family protein [Capsulimonadaceae bacterium]